MSQQIKKFNKTLLHFLKWVETQFPEEGYLTIFHDFVEMMIKTNSKKVLENFVFYVYPHKEKIVKQNEDFFMQMSLNDQLGDDKSSLTKALRMKYLWQNKLSDSGKETVWKYFKALIMLAEFCILEQQK